MTRATDPGPVLFCYDGSNGSREAMKAAGELIAPGAEVVVLAVWEPLAVWLALTGAFLASAPPGEGEFDEQEESFAQAAAQDGARRAAEHGYKASFMTTQATEGTARAILAVAEELSDRLIVCGQRGRGPLRSALLGSVSHALAAHTLRPILIAPESVS